MNQKTHRAAGPRDADAGRASVSVPPLTAAGDRRQVFTNALLALFAQKSSLKEYLDGVVQVIRDWTGSRGLGMRLVDNARQIAYEAWAGFEPGFLALENRLSLEHDNCFCIRAAKQAFEELDQPLLTAAGSYRCDDTRAWFRQLSAEQRPRFRGNCVKFGFASLAIIPIRYRNQVIGVVHLADPRRGQFPPAMVEFLESMTPLIGEAIRRFQAEAEVARYRDHLEELVKQRTAELESANAQLKQAETTLKRERDQLEIRVQQRTADLSASNRALQAEVAQRQLAEKEHQHLLRRLSDAEESERGRISRELHDQLGQELTALKLGLRLMKDQVKASDDVLETIRRLERLADSLMQALHRLAWDLHPAALDDLGLEVVLRRYTSEWSERNQLPLDFHCDAIAAARLPIELATTIYRILQEALTNVTKHAHARQVSVLLERRGSCVSLIVEDNGAGFDAEAMIREAPGRGKLGLLGMRERVTLAGGSIEVESTSGAGTTVLVRLPIPSETNAENAT